MRSIEFSYKGNVSQISSEITPSGITHADIIVKDLDKPKQSPMRLQAYGELAEYLCDLSWTDEEEKYLKKLFIYDSALVLRRIEIPQAEDKDINGWKGIPAKIIVADSLKTIKVFGPEGYLTSDKPAAMSRSEWHRFLEWRAEGRE